MILLLLRKIEPYVEKEPPKKISKIGSKMNFIARVRHVLGHVTPTPPKKEKFWVFLVHPFGRSESMGAYSLFFFFFQRSPLFLIFGSSDRRGGRGCWQGHIRGRGRRRGGTTNSELTKDSTTYNYPAQIRKNRSIIFSTFKAGILKLGWINSWQILHIPRLQSSGPSRRGSSRFAVLGYAISSKWILLLLSLSHSVRTYNKYDAYAGHFVWDSYLRRRRLYVQMLNGCLRRQSSKFRQHNPFRQKKPCAFSISVSVHLKL